MNRGAPFGTGSRASHEAASSTASSPEASIPSAAEIAAQIEAATASSYGLDDLIARATAGKDGNYASRYYSSSLDAAMYLLDPKNDWRRLTPKSMSIFAASPYNAAAQVRYDGYGATPALQLCAAVFKMRAALEAKALAAGSRRAETSATSARCEASQSGGATSAATSKSQDIQADKGEKS